MYRWHRNYSIYSHCLKTKRKGPNIQQCNSFEICSNTHVHWYVLPIPPLGGILAIATFCTLPDGQRVCSTHGGKNLFRTLGSLWETMFEEGRITKVNGFRNSSQIQFTAFNIEYIYIGIRILKLPYPPYHSCIKETLLYDYTMCIFIGWVWTSHLQLLWKHCGRV